MSTWILGIVSFSVGALAVWAMMRRRHAHDPGSAEYSREQPEGLPPIHVTRNQPSKRNRRYYGVSVQPGINPCKAVEKIRWRRYLTTEAPKLPLPGCKRPECRCYLMPENDRRSGFDRRGDSFAAFGDYVPQDYKRRRRSGPDRRDN